MTNMPLETIFDEIANFGRPSMTQFSSSASGGKAAGKWRVGVNVLDKVSVPHHIFADSMSVYDAASACLDNLLDFKASKASETAIFISVSEAQAAELE